MIHQSTNDFFLRSETTSELLIFGNLLLHEWIQSRILQRLFSYESKILGFFWFRAQLRDDSVLAKRGHDHLVHDPIGVLSLVIKSFYDLVNLVHALPTRRSNVRNFREFPGTVLAAFQELSF